MSMNDTIEAYRAQKGEWDDLREQRVFRKIQERRGQRPNRRGWIALAGGGAAVAAAAIIGMTTLRGPHPTPSKAPAAQALQAIAQSVAARVSVTAMSRGNAPQINIVDG